MKRFICVAIGLSSLCLNLFAQTSETFDISSFRSPKGWSKQAGQDAIQFSTTDNANNFCLVTLFKSVPSIGSPQQNFDASWKTIVKEAVTVSSAPQMMDADNKGEWLLAGGSAPFEKDGAKGVALLYTATGYGKMVNALVLTNTQAFEPELTAFLNSISFKKPEAAKPVQPPVAAPNGSGRSLAGNFWKQGGVQGGMLGHSGLSTATFSKTYYFAPDGTYKFFTENMQLAAPKYYLENEDGTYKVSGNTITIAPKHATFSQYRLSRTDPPIKSGNLPLLNVQYKLEFWLYDDVWRILLSPVDGNENKRDGGFSFYRNGEPQRTYQYMRVNADGVLIH